MGGRFRDGKGVRRARQVADGGWRGCELYVRNILEVGPCCADLYRSCNILSYVD